MNDAPKVTVYIAAHNCAKYLEAAIESVLRQSMSDWELLVFDDNSTDKTPAVLDLYRGAPGVRVFRTGGVGLPGVCNLACAEARGEYLIRLDGDDLFEENILLVLANVSVWGTLIWLASQKSWALRLAFLLIGFAGHLVHSGAAPGWLKQLAYSPLPWMYNFSFAKYLFIVIPGTIVGDMMVRWMAAGDSGAANGWTPWRVRGLGWLLVVVLVFVHVGLQARWSWWVLGGAAPMLALATWLTVGHKNSSEYLVAMLLRWSMVWLGMGLLVEQLEIGLTLGSKVVGGIKKDPSTMAYYLVSLGLSIQALIVFVLLIDFGGWRRSCWLFISNGQNPMLAYVGIRNLLAPVVNLLGLEMLFMQKVFHPSVLPWASDLMIGWLRFIWSMAKAVGLAAAVGVLTRYKIVWRS